MPTVKRLPIMTKNNCCIKTFLRLKHLLIFSIVIFGCKVSIPISTTNKNLALIYTDVYPYTNFSNPTIIKIQKIKTRTTVNYDILIQDSTLKPSVTTREYFNKNGILIQTRYYEYDSSVYYIEKYHHNKSEQLVKTTRIYIDKQNVESVKYSYNKFGFLSKKIEGNIVSKYKYDKKGNLIEEKFYYKANEESKKNTHTYEFNTNGKEIKYFTNGQLENIFLIDSLGRKVETCNSFHNKGTKSQYIYNHFGYIDEIKIYEADGSYGFSWIYVYDKNGNIIQTSAINKTGKIDRLEKYFYSYF